MLSEVADGVLVRTSGFMQSSSVVVHGAAGVLVVDAGVLEDELGGLAGELAEAGRTVVAGFSTHPHWDHLLWDARLGPAPRYGTARAAAVIGARLSDPSWPGVVAGMIPPDIADRVPLDDLFGRIAGLPDGSTEVPWDGPRVRVLEHQAHAPGHAALVVEDSGVLVAGDMLSDLLIPILNPMAPDPIEDHLAALRLLESAAGDVDVVIPGHGSVGDADELRARIDLDRTYIETLRAGGTPDDPRLDPAGALGEVTIGIHQRQLARITGASGS